MALESATNRPPLRSCCRWSFQTLPTTVFCGWKVVGKALEGRWKDYLPFLVMRLRGRDGEPVSSLAMTPDANRAFMAASSASCR